MPSTGTFNFKCKRSVTLRGFYQYDNLFNVISHIYAFPSLGRQLIWRVNLLFLWYWLQVQPFLKSYAFIFYHGLFLLVWKRNTEYFRLIFMNVRLESIPKSAVVFSVYEKLPHDKRGICMLAFQRNLCICIYTKYLPLRNLQTSYISKVKGIGMPMCISSHSLLVISFQFRDLSEQFISFLDKKQDIIWWSLGFWLTCNVWN